MKSEHRGIGTIPTIIIIGLLVGSAMWPIIDYVFKGYDYDRNIGDYFELADRASSATTKANYMQRFVNQLQKYGLTEGETSVFFGRPTSSLQHNYNVTLSLLSRLNALSQLDPKSFEYQTGMQQITLQEFCWFPIDVFWQGYALKNGLWWAALMPIDVYNRCATKSS